MSRKKPGKEEIVDEDAGDGNSADQSLTGARDDSGDPASEVVPEVEAESGEESEALTRTRLDVVQSASEKGEAPQENPEPYRHSIRNGMSKDEAWKLIVDEARGGGVYKIVFFKNTGRAHAHSTGLIKISRPVKVQDVFLVLHEIGHVFHGHRNDGKPRYLKEYEATAYMIERAEALGLTMPPACIDDYKAYVLDELDRGLRRGLSQPLDQRALDWLGDYFSEYQHARERDGKKGGYEYVHSMWRHVRELKRKERKATPPLTGKGELIPTTRVVDIDEEYGDGKEIG